MLQRADIWSAGIILYAMLFGQYPFDARDPRFARKVVTGAYSIPERVPVSLMLWTPYFFDILGFRVRSCVQGSWWGLLKQTTSW